MRMFVHELFIFNFLNFILTMVRIPSFDKSIKIAKSPKLENQIMFTLLKKNILNLKALDF